MILSIATVFVAMACLTSIPLRNSEYPEEEIDLNVDDIVPMNYQSSDSFIEDFFLNSTGNPIAGVSLLSYAKSVGQGDGLGAWESISPYYDAFPVTDNSSNFHSHATATYDNINGKTVTVDTLYRNYGEALNDPNFAFGMLIYQCILYKIAHPNEDVEISISSLRFSPTIAVCLDRNNRYFGYVRSMHGDKETDNYDGNGFVRISYLLVEAARMGIDVAVLSTREAYGAKQYNKSTGKVASKKEPYFMDYFNKAMNTPCYDKYDGDSVVSDYLTVIDLGWDDEDKANTDIVHVKTCAVSAYQDQYGMDHEYGVWFSSTNLDTVDYKGCNANGCSQSGAIITNHEQIYHATKNFLDLNIEHSDQEDVFEFRRLVKDRTKEQIEASYAGRGAEIPNEERIVYVGSDTDEVFEIYFAPIAGNIDEWDTQLNPYCKYLQEFYDSDDNEDVVFCINSPNFTEDFLIADLLVDVLEKKFVTNKRLGNRLGIRCENGTFAPLKNLKAGKDLEYIYFKVVKESKYPVHEKDILMSYVKDGERKYVSLLSSCNFNIGALYYQTNHILLIKETEETDNVVYTSIGSKFSRGVITDENEGMEFSSDERLVMKNSLNAFPYTLEAVIQLDPIENNKSSYGNLLANSDRWNRSVAFEINGNGCPQIVFGTRTETNTYTSSHASFNKVKVNTGEKIHLGIVIDADNRQASCYVNGVCKQTVDLPEGLDLAEDRISVNPFVVGGNHLGSNYNYFRGTIFSLSTWSVARTKSQIQSTVSAAPSLTDQTLTSYYQFYGRTPNTFTGDLSSYNNNLQRIPLWMDEGEVMDVPEDAYCFAIVPDTQVLSYMYDQNNTENNSIQNIYQWLLENKDDKNIQYVIGVGDITEKSVKSEYDNAWNYIKQLSGNIPFSVVMGNHDKYDFKDHGYIPDNMGEFMFNQTFYNDTYLSELDGWYGQRTGENDVSCSYNAFTIGETKWLLLNLDFGPTDDMLEWAGEVVAAHPDHKVIVSTHAYLYRDGSTLDEGDCYPASGHNASFNDGDEIYVKLISQYENIELVVCGHDPWDYIVCSQTEGNNGNTVTSLLIDAQYMDKYYGSTEMVALLYFSADGNTMTVRYYSVAKEMYGSVLSQFTVHLN